MYETKTPREFSNRLNLVSVLVEGKTGVIFGELCNNKSFFDKVYKEINNNYNSFAIAERLSKYANEHLI